MSNGHFLNGTKCDNCGFSWWEFDQCCKEPRIKVNPNDIYRYGSNDTIHLAHQAPIKKTISIAEAFKRGLITFED